MEDYYYCLHCGCATVTEAGEGKDGLHCRGCGAWEMDLMPWPIAVQQYGVPPVPVVDGKTSY